jgi:hypothetical protein
MVNYFLRQNVEVTSGLLAVGGVEETLMMDI